MENTKYIKLSFDDEVVMLENLKKIKENKYSIVDVFTPFPVHGVDKVLGHKESRIPIIGFVFGTLGALVAIVFQWWVMAVAAPINIGGKPFFALPAFIPVTFEITILFAGVSMFVAFIITTTKSVKKNKITVDIRATDDKFLIYLNTKNEAKDIDEIKKLVDNSAEIELLNL